MTRRAWGAWLLALGIAGAAGRAAYAAGIGDCPLAGAGSADGPLYDGLARRAAGGERLTDGAFFFDPLYPWLLGIWYAAAGPGALIVLQASWTLLAALFVADGARGLARLGGASASRARIGGVVAFGALWLSGPLWVYESAIGKEPLALPLVAGAAWALVRWSGRPAAGWLIAAGLAASLAATVRGNASLAVAWLAVAVPAAAAVRAPHGLRVRAGLVAGAAFVLAAALPYAAIFVRNGLVAGEWVTLPSHGGINLHLGNHAGATLGTEEFPPFVRGSQAGHMEAYRQAAEALAGHPMTLREASAFWADRAWEDLRADPGRWARLWMAKLGWTFHRLEIGSSVNVAFLARWSPAAEWAPGSLRWAIPLAFVGLLLASRARGARAALVLLLGAGAAYVASLVLFYTNGRMRLPLVPGLALFAGVAVALVRLEPRRVAVAAMVVLVLVGAWANWPVPEDDFQTEWINLGILALNAGEPERALEWLARGTPDDRGEWHEVRGDALRALGRGGEAREAYAAAYAQAPSQTLRAKIAGLDHRR